MPTNYGRDYLELRRWVRERMIIEENARREQEFRVGDKIRFLGNQFYSIKEGTELRRGDIITVTAVEPFTNYCGEKTCCYAFKEADNPSIATWLRVRQNFELVLRVTARHKILDKMIKVKVRRIKQ